MDAATKDALAKAHQITAKIEKLHEQQEALIEPIVTAAIERDDVAEMEKLLDALPRGFHRTELRTWLNVKREKEQAGTPATP